MGKSEEKLEISYHLNVCTCFEDLLDTLPDLNNTVLAANRCRGLAVSAVAHSRVSILSSFKDFHLTHTSKFSKTYNKKQEILSHYLYPRLGTRNTITIFQ